MIQPLRRTHYWATTGLGIILPMVFLAGLAARTPFPPERQSLPGVSIPNFQFSALLQPYKKLLVPDLIVYWSASQPPDGALPANAKLLGSLHGPQTLNISTISPGYLLLYSVAHQQLVAEVLVKEVRPP
jgi:hypothetical protein